ncbi:MAG: fumarylacetoacetate hydrolase family protein [Planctomycetes bacterium]|nr:fumarylacetoacetate hydrolase family protein [Planctomycetota bacterium]
MRLCRFTHQGQTSVGIYDEQQVVSLSSAARAYADATHENIALPASDNLLDYLPAGTSFAAAKKVAGWVEQNRVALAGKLAIATSAVKLHVPIPRPNKLFLLAGNYADHIKEGGGIAAARAETFPYVFMKPPTTTLTDPGAPVVIPKISPAAIDWELELAVVIGKRCKAVPESEALGVVAGYTVINDISNRKFRPNPGRKKRDKDEFFDWLHGKWHDSFCPCGPCITSADVIADPQQLAMQLKLNGELRQNSTTGAMIFPVAAIIEFISNMVTLEPGDIISTGTPAGVGASSGTFVKPGDRLEASIERIGLLSSPIVAE